MNKIKIFLTNKNKTIIQIFKFKNKNKLYNKKLFKNKRVFNK